MSIFKINVPISTVLLATISVCLLVCVPLLMQYPSVLDGHNQEDDVWDIVLKRDTYYTFRLNVIIIGIASTLASLVILLVSFFNRTTSGALHLVNVTLFILVFTTGFRSYAYWGNGLYDVFKDGSITSYYDPAGLLPMAHFKIAGKYWRDAILYFNFICIFYFIPFLLFRHIYLIRRRTIFIFTNLIISVATILLFIIFFFLTPNYIGWLLD